MGFLSCLSFAFLFSTSLICSKQAWPIPNLKPDWIKRYQPNNSFLSDLKTQEVDVGIIPLHKQVFDTDYAKQKRKDFENMTREFDTREKKGALSFDEKKAQCDKLSEFSQSTWTDVRKYQQNKKLKELRNGVKTAAENDPGIKKIKKPIALIGGLIAFYSGEPLKYQFAKNSELIVKSQTADKKAEVSITSPLASCSMEYFGKAPSERNPFEPTPSDPDQREEKYKFKVSREIPILKVSSAITYGSTTSNLKASFTRPLIKNLSCTYETTHTMRFESLDPENGPKTTDHTVKLQYGFNF